MHLKHNLVSASLIHILFLAQAQATCFAPDGVSTATVDFLPCIAITGVDSSMVFPQLFPEV
jgi:hypothetical protein